ncbi:thiamine-phosphate kinase [Cohnella faecalis]|uniref:Thiamine-monophosphate kinase n=1 Tax=Cohnella faecalis TaxID=2315694 RepID=A0A398CEU1_9BACL|nr:thiamine-phosphate kinase [Cohnella faecalis]RIE00975.1 thiamine-phosphate kinase [Cohnella faecalis]
MLPLDEFSLIRAWTERRQPKEWLSAAGVRIGIGDDAAAVEAAPDKDWLFAVDTMVEEVHFRDETMTDEDVGYKALAANVSDIAAMGGVPLHALVSVSIPPSWTPERMKRLFDGLYDCAGRYGVAVVGGDTTSAPRHLVVSVTLVGVVEQGRAIRRSGASPGQIVFVTGPVGLSAGGLHGMLGSASAAETGIPRAKKTPPPPKSLVQAHRRPAPSVKAGRLLLEQGFASSLNDVSDGLASEAWEIAEASGVSIVLKEPRLPLAGELASYARHCGVDPLEWMLYGGEDYVLLGTADKSSEAELRALFRSEGLPLFVIGETEAGDAGVWLDSEGGKRKPLDKRGYNHFARG